jgi:hypothetical protein
MDAPAKVTVELEVAVTGFGSVTVKVPPHTGTEAFPATSPGGRTSVNPTPVSVVPLFGFVMVNVRVAGVPTLTEAGANAFAMDGGEAA